MKGWTTSVGLCFMKTSQVKSAQELGEKAPPEKQLGVVGAGFGFADAPGLKVEEM